MNDLNSTKILMKALADMRSRQIVMTKFNIDLKDFYPDSYVYAIANPVYPIFHEEKYFETDTQLIKENLPYYDTYNIKELVVTELAEFIDSNWISKKYMTFYEIEGFFRNTWKGKNLRPDLIHCLRYFYLDSRFDKELWEKILEPTEHPTEASRITRAFDNKDLRTY